MADVQINNEPNPEGNGASGWIIGLVVIILLILFLIFVLPMLQGGADDVETPDNGSVDIDVDVPDLDGGDTGAETGTE